MKQKNVFKRILLLVGVLGILCCSEVYAAIEPFDFYVYNTGTSFTPNHELTGNSKVYSGQAWCVKVTSLTFSNGNPGYGMCYVLYNGSKVASALNWVNYATAKKGYWGNYSGAAGYTYYLYGRMDNELTGSCISEGYWNSDTINAWF